MIEIVGCIYSLSLALHKMSRIGSHCKRARFGMGVVLSTILENRFWNGVLLGRFSFGHRIARYGVTCPVTTGSMKGYVLKLLVVS